MILELFQYLNRNPQQVELKVNPGRPVKMVELNCPPPPDDYLVENEADKNVEYPEDIWIVNSAIFEGTANPYCGT